MTPHLPFPQRVHRLASHTILLILYSDRPSMADFAIYGVFGTGVSDVTPDFEEEVARRPALTDWGKRVEDATRAAKESR